MPSEPPFNVQFRPVDNRLDFTALSASELDYSWPVTLDDVPLGESIFSSSSLSTIAVVSSFTGLKCDEFLVIFLSPRCAVIIVPFFCITVYGRWSNGEVSLSIFRCRTSTEFPGTMARDFAYRLRSAYRFIFIFASLSFSFNAWSSSTVCGCEIVAGSLIFISRPNSAVAGAIPVDECGVAL